MHAPVRSAEFQNQEQVQKFYVIGADERLPLADDLDTIIIPIGSATFASLFEAEETVLGTGSMIYVPANTQTEINFVGEFNLTVFNFSPALRQNVGGAPDSGDQSLFSCPQLVKDPPRINTMARFLRRISSDNEDNARPCMLAVARLLLCQIALHAEQDSNWSIASQSGLNASKVRMIDRYIEANLEDPLRLEKLAQLAGISRYHFLRSFKTATGLTPLQYILVKRVERARQMLKDSKESIAEVAYATGFSSQSHLNRTFKRHFGLTPGAYKRRHRIDL